MKYSTDLESLEKETEVFFFGASTKGGQRANRKKTGVHLRHNPSGAEVRVIEQRSQAQNRKIAFEKLQEILRELNIPPKERIPTEVPTWEKRKRLQQKKQRSEQKQLRGKPIFE